MRKKLFLFSIFAALLLLSACSQIRHDETPLPELRIGGTIYAPFFYRDISDGFIGVDVEIAEEACRRIGRTPVFIETDIGERTQALESGSIDCIWSCFTMDGRENEYLWAGPYMYTRRVIAVQSGSDIFSLSDLEHKRVAVQANSSSEEIILGNLNPALPEFSQLSTFSTVGEVFTALRRGYVDAIAGHESSLRLYTDEYPGAFRYLGMSIRRETLGVAFSPSGDRELVSDLTAALSAMDADGTIASILEKYGIDPSLNTIGGAG